MKFILVFVSLLTLPNLTFGQIDDFSWLTVRDGRTWFEVSDIYADGSVLSAGNHKDLDIDPGICDSIFTAPNSYFGAFVQKLNPDGTLAWAHEYSFGNGQMSIISLCIDPNGISYLTGFIDGQIDFDPSTPGFEVNSTDKDIFLLSFDIDGNFRWVLSIVEGGNETPGDVKTDLEGNVYLFGEINDDADLDPGPGVYHLNERWGYESFIEKLTTNGDFLWAKRTIGRRKGRIEIDGNQNIYIGNNLRYNAVTDVGDTLFVEENSDRLIQKLNSDGNQVWNRKYVNSDAHWNTSIALDRESNLYYQSDFYHSLNVDPGASELYINSNGNWDGFIQKIDSSGTMIWTKTFGGTGQALSNDIAISPDNYLYSVGSFFGAMDFVPSSTDDDLQEVGSGGDSYLAKFDLGGNFHHCYSFSSGHVDDGVRVHCDSIGGILFHGKYKGEFVIQTNLGPRFIPDNGGYFLLKFSDSNVNNENQLNIGLSPNPVNHIVSVDQLDNSEYAQPESHIVIKVYDDLGRFLFDKESDTPHTELNLSNYRAGVYYIEVRRGGDFFLEKVSKVGK